MLQQGQVLLMSGLFFFATDPGPPTAVPRTPEWRREVSSCREPSKLLDSVAPHGCPHTNDPRHSNQVNMLVLASERQCYTRCYGCMPDVGVQIKTGKILSLDEGFG